MSRITLKQAAQWCGGYVEEKYQDVSFFGAHIDTRELQPGQLFVALRGVRDGHDFIPAAMGRGAAAVLCSRKMGDYPAIYVSDTRVALGDIAREERRAIGMKVVGITGSVGKSTTKEMTATVLDGTFRVEKTPVNHNNDIGLPMAILSMERDTQVAVLEMGMNHFREMAYLSGIAHPDIALILNIGSMHIENLGTMEGIRRAKMEILEGMEDSGQLILNGDDSMLRNLVDVPRQPVSYFGSDEGCQCQCLDPVQDGQTLRFRVRANGEEVPVELNMEGLHYVPDALAAISVGLAMGVPLQTAAQRLRCFRNLAGRQEIIEAKGFTIIKDCYNAGPESMEAALKVLSGKPGRRLAVLGDMLELGTSTQAEHYRVGRIAAGRADLVYAYGENAPRVRSGCITGGMPERNVKDFRDREELIRVLKRDARQGDVLLFKGSHGMHMETILDDFLAEM